jgi:hypothetical protein
MADAAQPPPETDEKKSRGLGSYVLWAFVAVVVYVLSSGAAFRRVSPDVYSAFYQPLLRAYADTPLRKPIGIYWHLCNPKYWDEHGEYIPQVWPPLVP